MIIAFLSMTPIECKGGWFDWWKESKQQSAEKTQVRLEEQNKYLNEEKKRLETENKQLRKENKELTDKLLDKNK